MQEDYKTDNLWFMKGDCLERMKEIPDGSVDMILTDPPYGTTVCKWDSIIPLEPMWEQLKRIIKPNGAIVLFGKEPFSSALRMSNIKNYKYDWIWSKDTKSNFPQAHHQPLNNIENIIVFSDGYARNFPKDSDKIKNIMTYNPQFSIGREYKLPKPSKTTEIFRSNHKNGQYKHKDKDTTKRFPFLTINFNAVKGKEKQHPTQKPVALMEYLISTYTNVGETVLDFTAGSFTTGVACVNLDRNFIGIEMDNHYYDIGTERVLKALVDAHKEK
jgi:site-specific DNA-methyltransferase (adenine-specific)